MEKNRTGNITNVSHAKIGDETHYHYDSGRPLPKELTLSIPKTHPQDIIGRETDLTQLHDLLNAQQRVVLVNGLGGIGKTTLAQAYVARYYIDYQHIVWIVQTQENVANEFINARGLIEVLEIPAAGMPSEELFEEIIRKLKGLPRYPNLLVIDNGLPSLKDYLDLLPGQPQWHVLVTSREKIAGLYLQSIGFLDEEQSITLFNKHYTRKRLTEQDIRMLVKLVDYHTLTIEMLAKTADMQRFEADQLKHAIENDLQANIAVAHNHFDKVERVGAYLQTVFSLSKLSTTEIWLMKQFACLPPEFHSYDRLHELLVADGSVYAAVFSETLVELTKKGWLLENEGDHYKMHPVIAEVVKKQQQITISDVTSLLKIVKNKLSSNREFNPVKRFEWIPFGLTLVNYFHKSTSRQVAALLNSLGLTLRDLGDYKNARVFLEKALRLSVKIFGNAHPETAKIYSNVGVLCWHLGAYKKARVLLENALAIKEQCLAADHPSIAETCSGLSVVLKEQGDLKQARQLAERALTLAQSNLGETHPLTVIKYSNLASVLSKLGDFEAAKQMLEKVVQLNKQVFGDNHPTTAKGYSNLAAVLMNLKDYRNAKIFLDKAITLAEDIFGPDHPDLASKYYNMAGLLRDGLKEPHQALSFIEKTVKIYQKVLPAGSPRLKKAIRFYDSIQKRLNNTTKNN